MLRRHSRSLYAISDRDCFIALSEDCSELVSLHVPEELYVLRPPAFRELLWKANCLFAEEL